MAHREEIIQQLNQIDNSDFIIHHYIDDELVVTSVRGTDNITFDNDYLYIVNNTFGEQSINFSTIEILEAV